MQSIWTQSCDIIKKDSLSADIETEVAVIGAGLCGILTAYLLQEQGKSVVVLEANRICGGQTKNTTAKVTSQHGLIYAKLLQSLGERKTRQFAVANQKAIEEFQRIIQKENICCDYEKKEAFLYSACKENTLEQELRAALLLGLPASFSTKSKLPFAITGAIKFENQGQFNPLMFAKALAEKLTIYENTKVISVEEHTINTASQNTASQNTVSQNTVSQNTVSHNIESQNTAKKTAVETRSHTVTAKNIIFACHYPFINFPGLYFARMHQERSYVLALKNAPQLDGMYICAEQGGYSMRNYKDYLLFGGENHRTGENFNGGSYDKLLAKSQKLFPNAQEISRWSAQDCITADSVPYIGQYSPSKPHWYVATGFNKWGMTASMVSATILSDIVCDKKNPNSEVFNPSRFSLQDIPQIANEGAHSVKGIVKETLQIPQKTLDALPVGHGGVICIENTKVGVYKQSADKVYIVDTRCPHLGCQLSWNPDEKSWDCPCHGSRFDYTGALMDNPAQEDIKLE